jgi:enoyl-CoA hydratase/carnithine racemase
VRYEVDGAIATITLNRREAANAQNSELIDALDAAFDQADTDDEIRVVVLAAEGKHFSAGHDLKELLAGEEYWAAQRDTPEGKLRHEQTMYFDKLVKIRDFRKPTIAAVQGVCSAAGMMLACMCDLIVAADDARFSNPVLRMSGVGVELLIEPWELGPRKAKEFLLCAQELSAAEAERYGLVNRVVPRADLDDRFLRMEGAEVYRHAVARMVESTKVMLERTGLSVDDIDLFVAHQANARIIESVANTLGFDMAKVFINVDRVANTSSASIPLALTQAEVEGRLKPGDTVALAAFGAGFAWGAGVLTWKEHARVTA